MKSEKESKECHWKKCMHYPACPIKMDPNGCTPNYHLDCPECGRKVLDVPEIKVERCVCGWSVSWEDMESE